MEIASRTSRKAQASLYLGLTSTLLGVSAVLTSFYPLLVLVGLTAAAAILLGILSKRGMRRRGELLGGSGLATCGMFLSVAGVALGFFFMPFT
jgi:hypothetical protein